MDTISARRRSGNMRQIRSKHTHPEMVVRRLVHRLGFRYRLHVADLPGRPDIVIRRLRKIIDVRGCFWHRHKGCIDSHVPKSRREYWAPKLAGNVRRDKLNLRKLRADGWKVLTIWECEVGAASALKRRIASFLR